MCSVTCFGPACSWRGGTHLRSGRHWQMNSETVSRFGVRIHAWFTAMLYPGAEELAWPKNYWKKYPWWRFEPHPEWVEPHSTTLLEPLIRNYTAMTKRPKSGRRAAVITTCPIAAGIPGEVRFVYIPGQHFYNWTPPTVTHWNQHRTTMLLLRPRLGHTL